MKKLNVQWSPDEEYRIPIKRYDISIQPILRELIKQQHREKPAPEKFLRKVGVRVVSRCIEAAILLAVGYTLGFNFIQH